MLDGTPRGAVQHSGTPNFRTTNTPSDSSGGGGRDGGEIEKNNFLTKDK